MQFFVGNKIAVTLKGERGAISTIVGVVSYRSPAPSSIYRVVVSKRGEYLQVDFERQQATFAYSSQVFQIVETKEFKTEEDDLEALVEKNSENLLTQAKENGNLKVSEGQGNQKMVNSRRLLENLSSLKETTTKMAAIDLSKLPVSQRGKTATEAFIAIRDNGQIQLNSLAEKDIAGATRVGFDWDPAKGTFGMIFSNNEKNTLPLNRGKEGKNTPTVSGAGILKFVGFPFGEGNTKLVKDTDYKVAKNKAGDMVIVVANLLTKERVPAVQREKKGKPAVKATPAPADTTPADETIDDAALLG